MSDERRRQADSVFRRALDAPAHEREAFVREVCADDAALLDEVLTLLRNDPGTAASVEALVRLGPPGRFVGDPERIGSYRVLERLGEGTFGVVYEVEQTEPIRRRLALKLLKAGMDTERVLARFEAERQALALMDHPNVARVVDAGATEQGRPYFVMELVRGDPISLYCDRERLDVDSRIALFLEACRAVQHAHQRGVLHRDLKPSNVLVTHVDGRPTVKIIDFGIAKALTAPLVDRTLHTIAGEVMGTPAYMSPEQSNPGGVAVDTASDVYSLGVMLYELLCGDLPVDPAETIQAAARVAGAPSPRRPRKRAPSARFESDEQDAIHRAWWRGSDPWHLAVKLRGDLDWVVMRAIKRDRSRRYQTVMALHDELLRYQRHEPVLAGPPSLTYRARKFVRRHWVGLGFVATVVVGLLVAGGSLTWALLRAQEQRTQVENARAEAEDVLEFLSATLASAQPSPAGADPTVREVLDRAARRLRTDFADRPGVEARLRTVVGAAYRELGRWDEAEAQLDRANELAEALYDRDHPQVLSAHRARGLLERHRGNYEHADSLLGRVASVRRRSSSSDPIAYARAITELAEVRLLAEQDTLALPMLEEALVLAESNLAPNDSLIATITSDLGVVYQALGRFDEAERALLRSHAIEKQRWGASNPATKLSGVNLAAFYRQIGDLERALLFYREAYAGSVELYGAEGPMTIRVLGNMVLVLSDLGRYEEADTHSRFVVETRERTLGSHNPSTIASRLNHTQLLTRMGRFAEAFEWSNETIDRCRVAFPPVHLYTLIGLGRRATLHLALDRADDGLADIREVFDQAGAALPADHWRTGVWHGIRGRCLAALGRDEEAERELSRAYAVLIEQLGPEHTDVAEAARHLADFYTSTGQVDRAADWRERHAGVR